MCSRSFPVSGLMFKSLINFGFISYVMLKKGDDFILLHVAIQFSQYHLLKKLYFPYRVFLAPLLKFSCLYMCEFIYVHFILNHWSVIAVKF